MLRSKVLKTEYKASVSERLKWRNYMRERRKKIKLGLLKPTPFNLKTKTKQKHYFRDYSRKQRRLVISMYGDKCACCSESQFEFLSIDHVDGGGNKHRKEIGGNFYNWIIRNNFPKGYQVLCYNCNFAKGHYKNCPHIKILTK